MKQCSTKDCDKPHKANNLCYLHDAREYRKKRPLISVYSAMKQRCYNENNLNYKHYGGRGIKMCDSWFNSFSQFEKDMSPNYMKGLTIERIDNDKGYEPSNCKWATQSEQNYNQRVRSDNKYGVTGLSWDESRKKWRAVKYANKKQLWSYRFDTKEEAIKALQ